MEAALAEARTGAEEGGIPIGAVLVREGRVVGRGRNRRLQRGSPILHAEMDALENAGRLGAQEYRRSTLYTTLAPCDMCAGAILLYGIPRVVMAEDETYRGAQDLLRARGVEVANLDLQEAKDLMRQFIASHRTAWQEDIGQEDARA